MESIKITLETLYDILRNEKKRDELQKLEDTFYLDVVGYLKEKTALLNSKKIDPDILATGERDKIDYEIRSIKRILKDIYEKREKKILEIALNKSHTGSDLIDTSSMLREEKLFYQQLLNNLDSFRRGILIKIHRCEFPDLLSMTQDTSAFAVNFTSSLTSKESQSPITQFETEEETEENKKINTPENQSNTFDNNLEKPSEKPAINLTKIKFIRPTPKFIWKDMKEYGPFDPGEQIEIYPEVAELLIRKERAEKV